MACAMGVAVAVLVIFGIFVVEKMHHWIPNGGEDEGKNGDDGKDFYDDDAYQGEGNNKSNNDNNGDDYIMDPVRSRAIRSNLLEHFATTPEALRDKHSAQYAAFLWLVRDDPRQLDPSSVYLIQRYGLAVLWFATTNTEYEWHIPEEYKNSKNDNGEEGKNDGGDAKTGNGKYRKLTTSNSDYSNAIQTWTNHDHWLSDLGVCGWEGVKCHPRDDGNDHDGNNDGDVSRLEMRRNNMLGLIPRELYTTLPYLEYVDMSDNG